MNVVRLKSICPIVPTMDTQSIILSTGKCLQCSFHCFSSHFFTNETLANKTVYAKTNYNFFFLGRDKGQQSKNNNLHYHPTTSGEVSLPLYKEIPVSTERQPRVRSNEKNLTSVGWLIFWFPPLCCKEKSKSNLRLQYTFREVLCTSDVARPV